MIDEKDFLLKAQTGDILLLKGTDTGSKFIRTFTWSNFDHIGVVYKSQDELLNDELRILHCTTQGTSTHSWPDHFRNLCGPGKLYEQVVFRHINFDRTYVMLDNFNKFV